MPDRRFVVGVQWHPEQDGGDLRLFEALVSGGRRAGSPHDDQGASRAGL